MNNTKLHLLVAASIAVLCAASTATAQFAKVSEAKATLPNDQLDYRGQCPVELRVDGTIKTEGAGIVNDQFVHTRFALGPVQRLVSLGAGRYTVRQNPAPVMNENAQYWTDTVTLRILSNPGGDLDSAPVNFSGVCQRLTAVTPTATQSTAYLPAQARFRVTINGFTCNKDSGDGTIFADGSGDEVFLLTKTFDVELNEKGGAPQSRMGFWETYKFGDVAGGGWGQRVRAGSSRLPGAMGGIVSGDSYPESPEKRSSNPQRQVLPQLVWEGTLVRFKTAAVVIPTIWESDGRSEGFIGTWQNLDLIHLPGRLVTLISNPSQTDQTIAKNGIRAEIAQPMVALTRSGDMPVGLRGDPNGGFRLRAEMLILTYDEAMRLAQANKSTGKAFPLTYVSEDFVGGASYTLWMQVEELP